MKGTITMTGRAAWFYYRSAYHNKGEAFRPMVKRVLKNKFRIIPLEFDVTCNTLDTFVITYKSDMSGNYLNMEQGGILLDKPEIYLSDNLPPKEFKGPRYFRSHKQIDRWTLPKAYSDANLHDLSSAYGKGNWEIKGNIVTRHYNIKEHHISAQEKDAAVEYLDRLKYFSKTTVWKKS